MNPVKDLFFNSSIRRVRDQEFLPIFLINATYGLYLDPYAISFLALSRSAFLFINQSN